MINNSAPWITRAKNDGSNGIQYVRIYAKNYPEYPSLSPAELCSVLTENKGNDELSALGTVIFYFQPARTIQLHSSPLKAKLHNFKTAYYTSYVIKGKV